MADYNFVADQTIPGLSARDLARQASDAIGISSDRQSAFRKAFRGFDRRALQDIGIDREGC